MRTLLLSLLLLAVARGQDAPHAAAAPPKPAPPDRIQLPGGEKGVGLDDLQWSAELGRVIVPAGLTGAVDLVEPATGAIEQVTGFGGKDGSASGHGDGSTSAVFGAAGKSGWLLAIDRSRKELAVADAEKLGIVARVPLAAGPDYVRWVAGAREIWVTEPRAEQIEIFTLPAEGEPKPVLLTHVSVPGGPESLVMDPTRGRAYTHLWSGTTVAIELASHAVVARWSNGCEGSRGIALDEAHGWLFVGCEEGRATVLDLAHDGKPLGSAPTGKGVDIISYDPARRHLYVPAEDGTLTILGAGEGGVLAVLATHKVAQGAQGVTNDGAGHVYVGDPDAGRLWMVVDDAPVAGG
jgi:hypothetical protein